MALKDLEDTLADTLRRDSYRDLDHGLYHPSTITGCPLKGFLDRMTENHTELNNYMFQGSAVHYYLQNKPSLLTSALHDAGFHPLGISYEEHTYYDIGDNVTFTGTCDAIAEGPDGTAIVDIKYSSVRPETHQGRLYQYMSQTNTYAHMFGADEYGLLLIYAYANDNASGNKPKNIPDSILLLPGNKSEDNWNITKAKARQVHSALDNFGYGNDMRWEKSELEAKILDFWEKVMEFIDKDQCPSYEKECDYCDHSEYCPVNQGEFGGLRGLGQ